MLGRLARRGDVELRRRHTAAKMMAAVSRIAAARIPPEVHENLPMFIRAQSRLLLADDLTACSISLPTSRRFA